jgi:hypothetical protein
MNERDVTALLERRATAVPTSDPPIDEILEAVRRGPRRHRHRNAFLAAAAVLALIVGAGVSWDAARDESSPPLPTDTPLPVHDGYRWVGMNGIAIEVPASWAMSDGTCAPESLDTVVFEQAFDETCQDPRVDPDASSLHFETLESRNFIAEMAAPQEQHTISIGRAQALVTDTLDISCGPTTLGPCVPVFGSSIEVPSRNVLVWVESPAHATPGDILATARTIPEGYVAVPTVIGREQWRAADQLGRLGLRPKSLCPGGGHVCDGALPVRRQEPAPGTIVTMGSPVRMVVRPPQNPVAQ